VGDVDGSSSAEARARGQMGLWRWRPDRDVLLWDEACARMFGALPGESPVQTWARAVHPDDLARMDQPEHLVPGSVTTFRVRRDGGWRFLLRKTTEVDGGDGSDWVVGVNLDITEGRERADRAVAVLESMRDGFIVLDEEYRFTYLNQVAVDELGGSYEALIGSVAWEVLPQIVGSEMHAAYVNAMERGGTHLAQWRAPGSGRWFETWLQRTADGLSAHFRDISDRHAAAAEQQRLLRELHHQATHDTLTGLVNRQHLTERIEAHLASSPEATAAVVFLDLDRFKHVNDTMGHTAGDELLTTIAARLAALAATGPCGTVAARLGGDEFVLALHDATAEEVEDLARRARSAIDRPVLVQGQELHVTTSLGLALGSGETGLDALLARADVALYRAKDGGRDQFAWYDAQLHDEVVTRVQLERDLREALTSPGQLALHYQPSYALASGRPTGVEALLRWTHPVRGPVPPSTAVPVAEESGLIVPLGAWVLREAVRQAAAWRSVPDLVVWLNVSPRQLAAGGFADLVAAELAAAGLPAGRLGIEVTEQVLEERRRTVEAVGAVRALGVRIAIDDFGTGHSSLARLLDFPVDVIKVDRSFVAAERTAASDAVLTGIMTLAHGLGASVIAEGVETWEQLQRLRWTSCDAVTGFLLGRPVPAEEQHLRRVAMTPPETESAPVPRATPLGADAVTP
jgi:diguanylate cyclase (GGDEF)-like protein/PAS domain S-box-containing protein